MNLQTLLERWVLWVRKSEYFYRKETDKSNCQNKTHFSTELGTLLMCTRTVVAQLFKGDFTDLWII